MPKIFHGLGLVGPYQLAKTGAIKSDDGPFNPLVACCFAPLCARGSILLPRRNASLELRWVPLPHLIALSLGTGLLNGQPIEVGNYQSYRIRVESRPRGVQVSHRRGLEAADILPRSAPDSDTENEAQVGESLWYEFASLDARFDRVIVACSALFFAYFAPSSQLSIVHLQGEFPKLLEQLERNGKARRDKKTGICYLELGSAWHTSDIPTIARSIFDQTGFAREAAETIGVQAQIQRRDGKLVQIYAVPPFLGATELHVKACERVVPSTGERVLIVLQILACSAEFPCSRLEATLDQPGRSSGNEPSFPKSHGSRKISNPFDFDFVELDGEGSRPGTDFVPITISGGSRTRYSALTSDNYLVTRREVNRSGRPGGEKTGQDPRNSSQSKSSKGDGGSRQCNINTRENATGDQDAPGGPTSKRMTPADALRHTTKELTKAAADLPASINSLLVAPNGLQYGPWVLNRVSDDVGRPKRWTAVLNGTRPRGVLIADVVFHERHAYVFDIVRRIDESFSILVIHQPDFTTMPDAKLLRLFNLIDDAQRLPKDEVLAKGSDLRIQRVTHHRASSPHSLSGVLGKLLK